MSEGYLKKHSRLTFSKMNIYPEIDKRNLGTGKQYSVTLPENAWEDKLIISPLVCQRQMCLLIEKVAMGFKDFNEDRKWGRVIVGEDRITPNYSLVWVQPCDHKECQEDTVYMAAGNNVAIFVTKKSFHRNAKNSINKVNLGLAL